MLQRGHLSVFAARPTGAPNPRCQIHDLVRFGGLVARPTGAPSPQLMRDVLYTPLDQPKDLLKRLSNVRDMPRGTTRWISKLSFLKILRFISPNLHLVRPKNQLREAS